MSQTVGPTEPTDVSGIAMLWWHGLGAVHVPRNGMEPSLGHWGRA